MSESPRDHVTRLLHDAGQRDGAREELLDVVYDHLRRIANDRMRGERQGHTLSATALVHEAFLKLVGADGASFESRGQFFATAARAMQQILIDHARARKADKRGGGRVRVPMSVVDLAEDMDPDQILALDEAMRALEASDPRAASVVRLRFFAGLEVAETAHVLGLSERTVMRDWSFARATLFDSINK